MELLDKDGNVIGSGISCTMTKPILMSATYDNAEVPNVATSQPKKATDTTPPTTPTLDTDLGGKGYSNTYYGDDRSKYSC